MLSVRQPSCPVPTRCGAFSRRMERAAASVDARAKVIGWVLED